MKHGIRTLSNWVVLLFICSALLSVSAGTTMNPIWAEVIVQVPNMDEKNMAQIKSELTANKGVQVINTCMKLKVVVLRVNRDVQQNDDFVMVAFKTLQMEYFIKDGTGAQINAACGTVSNDQNQN